MLVIFIIYNFPTIAYIFLLWFIPYTINLTSIMDYFEKTHIEVKYNLFYDGLIFIVLTLTIIYFEESILFIVFSRFITKLFSEYLKFMYIVNNFGEVKFSKKYVKWMFVKSKIHILNRIVAIVYTRSEILLLGLIGTKKELGYFAVAYMIYNSILIGEGLLSRKLFPKLTKNFNDRNKIKEVLNLSILYKGLYYISMMILTYFLKRFVFFLIIDFFVSFGTLVLSYNLRFNFEVPNKFEENFVYIFLVLFLLKFIVFYFFHLYNTIWRYFSFYEMKKIFIAHLIVYFLFLIMILFFREQFSPFPRSVIIIDFFVSILFITLIRFSKRFVIETFQNKAYKNSLLIGIDNDLMTLLNTKENSVFKPVAFIDDNKTMEKNYIKNIKIYSTDKIDLVIKSKQIDTVLISEKFSKDKLLQIYDVLSENSIKDIKLLSSINSNNNFKDITLEDLLARNPKDLDKEKIKEFINKKRILITGAGGSIGQEIAKICKDYHVAEIILLDNSEFNLYKINEKLKDIKVRAVLQSVKDYQELEKSFQKYKPQIVIHSAAYKHVPLVEENILEGITNNIIGTKNCIDLSIKYEVEKFLLISSDKAVRPTNVMGATKRVCELYAQNVDSKNTEIVSVRFGNVLGSSGSVIPKFKEQINNGGPVTVTHPDVTRYFMLISEACELVLQAASIGKGGEIFILDMGNSVKIVDLAKRMIQLSGKNNIKIEFCGLRPGEKLYEELLISDSDKKTKYESITVAGKTKYDINKLNNDIKELLICENKIVKLKEIVPEFKHKSN